MSQSSHSWARVARRVFHFMAAVGCFTAVFAANAQAQDDAEQQRDNALRAAVEKAAPSVVRIETFGGLEKVGRLLVGEGPTTGVVVDSEGYILSSAFNFVNQPNSILVTLPNGKRLAAQIVARDQSRMLILLKVESPEPLTAAAAVPREEMTVGQTTLALGRVYELEEPNLSEGILSAKSRIWGKAIQTDAKISPSNYGGPLIDLSGRVLGILVPLSPQGQDAVAGAEWYDSGIGFAIPLDDVRRHLEKMKAGQDLHPGILGVTLRGNDIYADPVVIAACQANSPAAKGGLQVGDRIIELEGEKIERQAQLRHALGSRYAGEKVKVVAMRGEERIEAVLELVDRLTPYQHPFLGIAPGTGGNEPGALVRYVYPGSGAAEAGLEIGDRIVGLSGREAADAGTLQDMLATHEPGSKVAVDFIRGGERRTVEVQLGVLPEAVPADLPPRGAHGLPAPEAPSPVGVVEVRLAEEKNECRAYIPTGYHPEVPQGLLIWPTAPGVETIDSVLEFWKAAAEERGFLVLAPAPVEEDRWQPTEAAFIRKAVDDLLTRYNVDRARVVVGGYQGGGAMAFLTAFAERDLITGLAAVDAPMPARARPPENNPIHRLAVVLGRASQGAEAARITSSIDALRERKFPVTVLELGEQARTLNEEEREAISKWLDSLDRI